MSQEKQVPNSQINSNSQVNPAISNDSANQSRPAKKKRTYRKNQSLFALIAKMKLWPSRQGYLHGIRNIEMGTLTAVITTHCGHTFTIYNSRSSRASRWLRNKSIIAPCRACAVPEWKLEKYQGTVFKKGHGSKLDIAAHGPGR